VARLNRGEARKYVADELRSGCGHETQPAEHAVLLEREEIDRFRQVELVVFALVGARRQPAPLQLLDIDAVADLMMLVELALIEVTVGAGDGMDFEHGLLSEKVVFRREWSVALAMAVIPISGN
jgi:hypothetical protein